MVYRLSELVTERNSVLYRNVHEPQRTCFATEVIWPRYYESCPAVHVNPLRHDAASVTARNRRFPVPSGLRVDSCSRTLSSSTLRVDIFSRFAPPVRTVVP